jgi:CheY-like chemotaxis protein
MGGEIYLDDDYHSGIPGHPGTRFVVDLKSKSIEPYFDDVRLDPEHAPSTKGGNGTAPRTLTADGEFASIPAEIPEKMSVLFVDDDAVLRKLFSRSINALAPGWNVREAANGETAIQLTEEDNFDLIFVDMYMASVEKQLLGTETVSALRNKGVDCRICGLSANDKEEEFYESGADAFMFKPFPCRSNALKQALLRILYRDNKSGYDAVDEF